MDLFTYLTVPINLCLTWSIDVTDDAVKASHHFLCLASICPHDPSPNHPSPRPHLTHPLLHLCISSYSPSVQTTSRYCSSTTRPICLSVEQELLTPSVPWSAWDTEGRWVPKTELDWILKWYSKGSSCQSSFQSQTARWHYLTVNPWWIFLILLFLHLPAL